MNPSITALAAREIAPPPKGAAPLSGDALDRLARDLGDEWRVVEGHHLERVLRFGRWLDSLDFVVAVAHVAEGARHHPDIALGYDRTAITIYTHKIDGLHEADFILAARIEEVIDRFRDRLAA